MVPTTRSAQSRPAAPKSRLVSKLDAHKYAIRRGDLGAPAADIRRWIWSGGATSGYRKDLTTLGERPEAKANYGFAPLTAEQAEYAFDTTGYSKVEARELEARRRMYEAGLQTCYAGVLDDGTVAYLGFGFDGATQRDEVLDFFGEECFLPLEPAEMLVEGAWTHPEHRNINITTACVHATMAVYADRGRLHGITYIGDDNPASFLSARKNGFKRFVQRNDKWRFFRSSPTWTETDVELPRPSRPDKQS